MSTLHVSYCRTFNGELLEAPEGPLKEKLSELAEKVPALFGQDMLPMNTLLGQGQVGAAKVEFEQVLLIDDDWYYVAQVVAKTPETTLIAIAARTRNLASVLAEVREQERAYNS